MRGLERHYYSFRLLHRDLGDHKSCLKRKPGPMRTFTGDKSSRHVAQDAAPGQVESGADTGHMEMPQDRPSPLII